jgi:hypothetical protein
MSDDDIPDDEKIQERTHPALEAVVPLVMLVVSVAYAWSLRNVPEPHLNLLFLRPLFALLWVLLLIVLTRETIPSLRAPWSRTSEGRKPAAERFASGTEGSAFLVVVATLIYAFVSVYGDEIYIASTLVYLVVTSILIGERRPVRIIAQSVLGTAGIYGIMVGLLGVRF